MEYNKLQFYDFHPIEGKYLTFLFINNKCILI